MPDTEDKHTQPEWVAHRVQSLNNLTKKIQLDLVRYKMELLYQARKRYKEQGAIEIKPGTRVRVYLPVVPTKGIATKLAARWSTPYVVDGLAQAGKAQNTYIVKKESNSRHKSVPIHVSRIRILPVHKYAPRGMLDDDPDRDTQDSDSDCDDHAPLTEPISDALLGVAENRGTAVQQLTSR